MNDRYTDKNKEVSNQYNQQSFIYFLVNIKLNIIIFIKMSNNNKYLCTTNIINSIEVNAITYAQILCTL